MDLILDTSLPVVSLSQQHDRQVSLCLASSWKMFPNTEERPDNSQEEFEDCVGYREPSQTMLKIPETNVCLMLKPLAFTGAHSSALDQALENTPGTHCWEVIRMLPQV